MKRFYLLSVISLFSAGISAQEITGGERTLSAEQLYTLLRSIPASRIEKTEVM